VKVRAAGAFAIESAAQKVSTPSLTLPSFAKINWSLRILGRRPDGYHEIQTILQTVSLHDEMYFGARNDESITLTCNDPLIPTDDSNLVVRAASALRDRFKTGPGVDIRLEKRIPTKGGLGGASTNAAITLLALAQLWDLRIDPSQLFEIAATLGADVPFFLVGGRVMATGIGTSLETISDDNLPIKHLIIVTPKATVSTIDAYQALRAPALTSTIDDSILSSSRAGENFGFADLPTLHNDFEEVIFEAEPEIEQVKKALNQAGAIGSLLAGSGSSVFGIFENEYSQVHALRKLQAELSWRVFPVATISRREYLRALGPCGVSLSRYWGVAKW
jgi:4-diphosphocytidyl-2-C-methyl-D-erythritol kinase